MMPAQFNPTRWDLVTQQLEKEARIGLGDVRSQPNALPTARSVEIQEIYIYRRPTFWDYWPVWGAHREVHHFHPAPITRKAEREKQEDRADLAVWFGALAVAAGAFAVGFFFQQYQDAKRAYADADVLKKESFAYGAAQGCRDLAEKFYEIQQRSYSKVLNQTIAASAALVGGAITFIGGLTVAPWLITAGQVTLLAATALGLSSLGAHWSDDKKNKQDWTAIDSLIPIARDQMGLPPLYFSGGAA